MKFLPVLKDLFIEDKGDYISVLNKQYINQRLKIKSIRCKKISEQNSESKEYFINYFLNYGETKIVKPSSEDLNDQLFCTSIKFADQLNDEIYEKDIELSFKSKKTTINETDFLKYFYKKDKDLFLRDNVTIIDKNLYIPPSYRLVLTKGQEIKIIKNAFIFSESSIVAKGNKENRILISGEENDFGGGIIIKNSDENVLSYVDFKYLKGLDFYQMEEPNFNPSYRIYGSINFYNSNVQIDNTYFSNIKSEDALNIMNSNFEIKDSLYENIQSDAIDIDFGKGIILNSNFNNVMNDAIDLSGSDIVLDNIKTNSVGDKSISSGENSKSIMKNIKINKSFIGIANKDGSNVEIDQIEINDVEIPFAAYIKSLVIKIA